MDGRGLLVGFSVLAFAALATAPLACGSAMLSGNLGTQGDGGTASDGGSAGTSPDGSGGTNGDGGAGATCGASGGACTQSSECCSNLCLGNVCVASIGACGSSGASCTVGTDCCTGACVNGACGAAQCVSLGDPCPASGNACCTDTCVAGKCAPIGGGGAGDGGAGGAGCTTAGNTCAANGDCCSGLCSNGVCNIASSYCTQMGDICFHAADCCGGVCNSPNSSAVSPTNPGTCGAPPSVGGVNCSGVDGTLCDPTQVGCAAGCCSHLCAPFGPTGITICQQAQGCHVEGDLCRQNADCCGGEPADAGILGAGLVVCTIPAGSTIGYCTTPTGSNGGGSVCVPEGDVCHYTSGTGDGGYTCSSSSARSDCCGDQRPKFLACQLDKLGVPRCLAYGLSDAGTDGCRQVGATCATAADCCNGQPCVPDPSGQLVCAQSACIPSAGPCTSTADCCAGITCVIAPGAQGGTCAPLTPPPPPPPPPSDGGSGSTPDAGNGGGTPDSGGGLGCAEIGQSCTTLPCCAGLQCMNGSCNIPLK
jgi:hypothetical protein